MSKIKPVLITLSFVLLLLSLSACGSSSQSSQQGYKETKMMVLDILKTEDGKKAIKEATQSKSGSGGSKKMQSLSAKDSEQVQLAVKDVLTNSKNSDFLKQLMTDPRFAGDFAKAIKKENKQMMKDLMKDPDYQKSLIQTMKNPQAEKMLMDVMKSGPYRQMVMSVMQDSLKSPLFRSELVDLMKTALDEQTKPKKEKKGNKKSSGGGGGQSSS